MKSPTSSSQGGYALATVMVFMAVGMMVLTSAMQWTSSSAKMVDRNNQYYETLYAAEAGTEKVVAKMIRDFKQGDQSAVYNNLATYRQMVPSTNEYAAWRIFTFGDASGTAGRMTVENSSAWGFAPLQSQYAGLFGMAATYQVRCNARRNNSVNDVTACVQQDVQVATIPLFQFAIFYGMDMEISCGQAFNVTGRVHSNGSLYVCPDSSLTFWTDVTSVGDIKFGRAPGDSRGAPAGSVTYKGSHDAKTSSMNLPIGTNNTPEAVRAILQVPPAGEDANSLMGKQRMYNKADLILKVADTVTAAISGKTTNNTTHVITTNYTYTTNIVLTGTKGQANGFALVLSNNVLSSFVRVATNTAATNDFRDAREGTTVLPIDIDVGKLRTNTAVSGALGYTPSLLFVDDARTATVSSSDTMAAVRMVNGATLPANGLTVVTPDPLYVLGHYNSPSGTRGTSNTVGSLPASLMGDAITVLSPAWKDADSTADLASRDATHTTINAAFLAGIVPTTNFMSYSGGAENFPRFLEDWNPTAGKQTLTYNGSMVVLFPSQYATSKWGQSEVYDPPARNWAFDLNFMDATKLPPGTPSLSTLIRGSWQVAAPRRPN